MSYLALALSFVRTEMEFGRGLHCVPRKIIGKAWLAKMLTCMS